MPKKGHVGPGKLSYIICARDLAMLQAGLHVLE